jgi:hypothetical protein
MFLWALPGGRGRTYGFGNVTEPRFRDAAEGRLQRLRGRFAGFGGLVRDYLACLKSNEPIHYGPIEWLERTGGVLVTSCLSATPRTRVQR